MFRKSTKTYKLKVHSIWTKPAPFPCSSHLSEKDTPFQTGIVKDTGFLTNCQPVLPIRWLSSSEKQDTNISHLAPSYPLAQGNAAKGHRFSSVWLQTQNVIYTLGVALVRILGFQLSALDLGVGFPCQGRQTETSGCCTHPLPTYQASSS